MSDRPTATIVAFPGASTTSWVPAEDPHARLARALAALEQALADQRTVLTGWRDSLGALRGSMHGLGQSVGGYQSRGGKLAAAVGGANRQARRLEAWADRVLAPAAER